MVAVGDFPGLMDDWVGPGDQRPEFDASGVAGAVGFVVQFGAGFDDANAGGAGEDGVHQGEHGGGGAEGDGEFGVAEGAFGGLDAGAHDGAPAVELGRVGALEGVDGLLAVTDGEDGAGAFTGGVAGEELGGEGAGDGPLGGGGVLDFVEQEVVQPAIELEQDPGGARDGPAGRRCGR